MLGIGVAMLLLASLGSDGYSTLVNGLSISTDLPFVVMNMIVSVTFLAFAMTRRLMPGIGTITQVVVVGLVVSGLLETIEEPDGLLTRSVLLVAAMPVLALGIAAYLGSQTGAGPAEAAALAWDPPIPFKWSYSAIQGLGAVVGWLLGAAIGPGTIAVVVLLGPGVALAARLLRVETAQPKLGAAQYQP